ncbi:MAG: hypothetical protein CM1200mP3_06940 [Chloroflexota bacterium]|nr:MAG: hypothetical protein CM1200mP3_06940 [Chloroflexota bacterium]
MVKGNRFMAKILKTRAFMAGYASHLILDETWITSMFRRYFSTIVFSLIPSKGWLWIEPCNWSWIAGIGVRWDLIYSHLEMPIRI